MSGSTIARALGHAGAHACARRISSARAVARGCAQIHALFAKSLRFSAVHRGRSQPAARRMRGTLSCYRNDHPDCAANCIPLDDWQRRTPLDCRSRPHHGTTSMDRFAILQARARKWLTCFLTLGDPQALADQAGIYLESGVDVLEVGVPHANPYMDGPVVAQSMTRAVRSGVTHDVARRLLASLRRRFQRPPIVLMGYTDLTGLVRDRRGRPLADAVLQIGASPAAAAPEDIARIGFISNRASPAEIEGARHSSGYVMLQANEGKSGMRDSLPADNRQKIERIRGSGIRAPVLLGIGLSTPQHVARAVRLGADGVVIGSACLQAAHAGEATLRDFLRQVRTALDHPQRFLR
jgi:tryptophan synthase alpha chain